MSKVNLKKLEADLHAACQRVIRAGSYMNDGGTLGIHGLGYDTGKCLLGAIVAGDDRDMSYKEIAADVLGISRENAYDLEHGYMGGHGFEGKDDRFIRLGHKMREIYYGGTHGQDD